MDCVSCGREISDNAKSCDECGERQPERKIAAEEGRAEIGKAKRPVPKFPIPNTVERSIEEENAVISRNGRYLATEGGDILQVVDTETMDIIHQIDRQGDVWHNGLGSVDFDETPALVEVGENGAYVVYATSNGRLWMRDVRTDQGIDISESACAPAVFGNDGKRFAASQYRNGVSILDLTEEEDGSTPEDFSASEHPAAILLGFARYVKSFHSSAYRKELLSFGGRNDFSMLAFGPDDKRLATISGDSVIVWDAHSGKKLLRMESEHPLDCIAYSPDGKRIASTSPDGYVVVWDAETGTELYRKEDTDQGFHDNTEEVQGFVRFSPDGLVLVHGFNNKATLQLHDAENGELLAELPSPEGIRWASYTPGGRQFIVYDGSRITFWVHQ